MKSYQESVRASTHLHLFLAFLFCLACYKRNELLNEYPELAEELEEELKKMEEENAAKQEELAELQRRLEEQQSTEDGSAASGTGSGAAFVSSGKTTPSATTEQEAAEEGPDKSSWVEDEEDSLHSDGESDNGEEELTITETTEDVGLEETETAAAEKGEEQSSSTEGNATDVTTKPTTTS